MKYFLLFLFVLLNFYSNGQEVLISDEVSLRSSTLYEVVGRVKSKYFLIKGNNESYTIHAFDIQRMHESWDRPLKFEKKVTRLVGAISRGDHFLVFYHYKKRGDNYLRVRKYDDQLRLLDSTLVRTFENRAFAPKLEFHLSEDRNKVLFFSAERDKEIEGTMFDIETMETMWSNKFKPKDFSYYEDFLEVIADNYGGMHIISEKDNKRYKKDKNRFQVQYLNPETEKMEEYHVSMQGQIWYDVKFEYDNLNRKLVAGGLYCEKKNTDVTGYFYMIIDPNTPSAYKLSFTPLDRGDLVKLFGKTIKENRGFNNVEINDIIMRRDGGALLVVERVKEYVRQLGSASSSPYYGRDRYSRSQVDYYYDDILLLSVHPDGLLHWQEILHKKQYSQDDQAIFSSYFLMKTKSNLRFFYNDEIKSETPVSQYTVYGNGESKRSGLFSTHGKKLKLRIRDGLQISSTELLIPSERRNRLRLVLLTL